MFGVFPLLVIVVVSLLFGGFYCWARRQGLLAAEPTAEGPPGRRRISLLTEAAGYVGAILILAGGGAAIGQRWHDIGQWGHVGVSAAATVFFLLVGIIVRQVSEPAIQRLVGVMWFLSVAGAAWAVGLATADVYGKSGRVMVLAIGVAVTLYSAALWLARRRALQNVALFTGLIVTICGTISTVAGEHASGWVSLAFAFALWGFGLAWAWLGWRRYIEPIWVTIPSGVLLALIMPSFSVGEHGWLYAIAITTAAAAMAASVPLRSTPLLALGTMAMFGYLTSTVVQYFRESLGVPAALAITGVLIMGLAVVTARLMRTTRPLEPGPGLKPEPEPEPELSGPGAEGPARRELSKTS